MPNEIKPRRGFSSELASKLEPSVRSLARPLAESLLQARADVHRSKDLQAVFQQAREEEHPIGWLADNLTVRLAGIWGTDLAEAAEAARYLADEFDQLGEGIFVVSSETGKVIAKLDESDIYQPAPVPRESGEMAQPLSRIEPGLEAQIITWVFEKEREERITALLRERAHQTALLRQEGDRRLWVATRKGRTRMAEVLSQDHPKTLLEGSGGTSGSFLRHFDVILDPVEGAEPFHLETQSTLRVHDQTTVNLQYDRLNGLRGILPQGWLRELARQLSVRAHREVPPRTVLASNLSSGDIQGPEMWVADPETMLAFLDRLSNRVVVMPVDGSKPIGLTGKIGTLVIPEDFELENREIFGRWEVYARLVCHVVIYDWTKIRTLNVEGLAHQALKVF